jgi:lipid-A-disaccharide synthase
MAVILPFEEDFFLKHQVPVTFVGHPLLDADHCMGPPVLKTGNKQRPTIGLLPGSREREIARHLPVMLDAATILSERMESVQFVISAAASVGRETIETLIQNHNSRIVYQLVSAGVDQVFGRCILSVVASGTVTLEAAIWGMPMVIIYKVSPITYWLGRALVHVKHIGLVNLIADRSLAPELIQKEASANNIAMTVLDMLNDGRNLGALRKELISVREKLGGPGASERTADIALKMMQGYEFPKQERNGS